MTPTKVQKFAGGDWDWGLIVFGNMLVVAEIPPFESAYAGRICV